MQIENVMAGLMVGTLVGLTGVGGGSLMAPLLILVFGVAPATAVGTDLWFAAVTKAVGGTIHHRQGSIDAPVLGRLALGSIPASLATLLWLSRYDSGQSALLLKAIGLAILIAGGATILRTAMRSRRPPAAAQDGQDGIGGVRTALTVALGALLGVLVTLTSVGAGALGAVLLLFLYPDRLTPARLVGTDIAHAIPLTLLAGSGHLLMGHVDLTLLQQLLIGSVPGVVIGSILTGRLPDRPLKTFVGLALMAVGLRMLL